MKKLLSIAGIVLGSFLAFAQAPEKMSYQAVIRNSSGTLIANQNVATRVSILQGSESGTVVYSERLIGTTNANGLLSLSLGSGTVISGTFNTINWSSGTYYLKTETDPTGGTSYSIAGTNQLLSVPYALYAKSSGSGAASALWASSGINIFNSNTGGVGIGTNAPAYKLDVLHGGATGARIKSSSTFSILDIDGFNGDAAIRFANNGTNQWNIRNNPANNDLQFFELGGGGERLAIQDGTGNVAIGDVVPTFKLHVLHGGASGAKIQSSSSFSILDIDAANGDAAIRFGKNGVNQWNVISDPSSDNFQIFELGVGERFQIQGATGNVGINTANPTYKLHVTTSGANGAKIESTSTFSVLDLDAANGDAAIRFAKSGVNQWNVRNDPSSDNFQIFELGGGGERLQIQNSTGNVGIGITSPTAKLHVGGNFTATGAKAFTIDHPLDPTNKILRHFSMESNEVLNTYSGNITTNASGKATVQLPAYFEAINKDIRYQLTVIGTFAQAIISKKVNNNTFEVATSEPNVEVSWQIVAVRNDLYMQKVNKMKAEETKPESMKGKYIEPAAYNMPESAGVNYHESKKGDKDSTQIGATETKKVNKVQEDKINSTVTMPPKSAAPAKAEEQGSSSIKP